MPRRSPASARRTTVSASRCLPGSRSTATHAHPLYQYLKKAAPGLLGSEGIKWNFTKFLVNRQGEVTQRYAPATAPDAIASDIEALLWCLARGLEPTSRRAADKGVLPPARRESMLQPDFSAMLRWPNVPACYGWLSLDRRGRWRLRGEAVTHAGLKDFLNRQYAHDEDGNYFVQNGPQRVFVELDVHAVGLAPDGGGRLLETHVGEAVRRSPQRGHRRRRQSAARDCRRDRPALRPRPARCLTPAADAPEVVLNLRQRIAGARLNSPPHGLLPFPVVANHCRCGCSLAGAPVSRMTLAADLRSSEPGRGTARTVGRFWRMPACLPEKPRQARSCAILIST
jgi:hypothetical protein